MDFEAILTALVRAQVSFIVVGGVGAILQGVPMSTQDLDLVFSPGLENRRKLANVLRELDACYLDALPQRITPSEEDLASPLHHLLETRFGRLDLLGTVVGGLDHEDLLHRAITLPLDEGVSVRVLDLEALIEIKNTMGREKDRLQVLLMRHTLEEREKLDKG